MLTHVVLFKMKADADSETVDRLMRDALESLTQIPGVYHLSAGRVIQQDAEFDVALAMQFDDTAALEAYRGHPIHQDYVAFINTVTDGRLAYDFEN